MTDRTLTVTASIGLAIGGILGMAGTFAPSASLRGAAWGIDGAALVMATALLALWFYRRGHDVVAAGFLVYCIGESVIMSGIAMELAASAPSFAAGISLWAVGLGLISVEPVWPLGVRLLGFLAAALFAITAVRIFAGAPMTPLTAPLPFYAYPVLVATLAGWIVTLVRIPAPARSQPA
jgi:hypothetical protein